MYSRDKGTRNHNMQLRLFVFVCLFVFFFFLGGGGEGDMGRSNLLQKSFNSVSEIKVQKVWTPLIKNSWIRPCHHIYNHNKYNIAALTWYTTQYS